MAPPKPYTFWPITLLQKIHSRCWRSSSAKKKYTAAPHSAKFGTCTFVSVYGTHVEDKMRIFKGEYELFSFNKSPIDTQDSASAKFSTNSHETEYSAVQLFMLFQIRGI